MRNGRVGEGPGAPVPEVFPDPAQVKREAVSAIAGISTAWPRRPWGALASPTGTWLGVGTGAGPI